MAGRGFRLARSAGVCHQARCQATYARQFHSVGLDVEVEVRDAVEGNRNE